ncbi:MAG: MraY family glycosyltransferase [Sedimentisphaerales bacterium]|nr:MraY family glycosyltransferase [Sedimentisphaerales bacterium]
MLIALGILILLASLVVCAALTAMIRPIALRWGLVSHPREDRYGKKVVPLGGGIAILLAMVTMVLAGSVAIAFIGPRLGLEPKAFYARIHELLWIVVAMAGGSGLGLWDDRKALSPYAKLVGQLVVAAIAVLLGAVRLKFFISNDLVTGIGSILWIVLLMNIFNFLDNMDGLCAGVAAIVSSILLVAAARSGQILVGGLALATIGSLLGFLVQNLPPAKVFMGDAGSMLVGLLVAILSIRTTYYHQAASGPWYPVLMPMIALAVPLYDFVTVMALRIWQGKNPLIGDMQHFSHRLKRRGLTDMQTALTVYLATLCTGLGAVCLYQVSTTGAILVGIQTILILGIIAILETYTGPANGGR